MSKSLINGEALVEENASVSVLVRMTPTEKQALKNKADLVGTSVSNLMRSSALDLPVESLADQRTIGEIVKAGKAVNEAANRFDADDSTKEELLENARAIFALASKISEAVYS